MTTFYTSESQREVIEAFGRVQAKRGIKFDVAARRIEIRAKELAGWNEGDENIYWWELRRVGTAWYFEQAQKMGLEGYQHEPETILDDGVWT